MVLDLGFRGFGHWLWGFGFRGVGFLGSLTAPNTPGYDMLYMGVGSLVWFAAALLLDQSGLDRRL